MLCGYSALRCLHTVWDSEGKAVPDPSDPSRPLRKRYMATAADHAAARKAGQVVTAFYGTSARPMHAHYPHLLLLLFYQAPGGVAEAARQLGLDAVLNDNDEKALRDATDYFHRLAPELYGSAGNHIVVHPGDALSMSVRSAVARAHPTAFDVWGINSSPSRVRGCYTLGLRHGKDPRARADDAPPCRGDLGEKGAKHEMLQTEIGQLLLSFDEKGTMFFCETTGGNGTRPPAGVVATEFDETDLGVPIKGRHIIFSPVGRAFHMDQLLIANGRWFRSLLCPGAARPIQPPERLGGAPMKTACCDTPNCGVGFNSSHPFHTKHDLASMYGTHPDHVKAGQRYNNMMPVGCARHQLAQQLAHAAGIRLHIPFVTHDAAVHDLRLCAWHQGLLAVLSDVTADVPLPVVRVVLVCAPTSLSGRLVVDADGCLPSFTVPADGVFTRSIASAFNDTFDGARIFAERITFVRDFLYASKPTVVFHTTSVPCNDSYFLDKDDRATTADDKRSLQLVPIADFSTCCDGSCKREWHCLQSAALRAVQSMGTTLSCWRSEGEKYAQCRQQAKPSLDAAVTLTSTLLEAAEALVADGVVPFLSISPRRTRSELRATPSTAAGPHSPAAPPEQMGPEVVLTLSAAETTGAGPLPTTIPTRQPRAQGWQPPAHVNRLVVAADFVNPRPVSATSGHTATTMAAGDPDLVERYRSLCKELLGNKHNETFGLTKGQEQLSPRTVAQVTPAPVEVPAVGLVIIWQQQLIVAGRSFSHRDIIYRPRVLDDQQLDLVDLFRSYFGGYAFADDSAAIVTRALAGPSASASWVVSSRDATSFLPSWSVPATRVQVTLWRVLLDDTTDWTSTTRLSTDDQRVYLSRRWQGRFSPSPIMEDSEPFNIIRAPTELGEDEPTAPMQLSLCTLDRLRVELVAAHCDFLCDAISELLPVVAATGSGARAAAVLAARPQSADSTSTAPIPAKIAWLRGLLMAADERLDDAQAGRVDKLTVRELTRGRDELELQLSAQQGAWQLLHCLQHGGDRLYRAPRLHVIQLFCVGEVVSDILRGEKTVESRLSCRQYRLVTEGWLLCICGFYGTNCVWAAVTHVNQHDGFVAAARYHKQTLLPRLDVDSMSDMQISYYFFCMYRGDRGGADETAMRRWHDTMLTPRCVICWNIVIPSVTQSFRTPRRFAEFAAQGQRPVAPFYYTQRWRYLAARLRVRQKPFRQFVRRAAVQLRSTIEDVQTAQSLMASPLDQQAIWRLVENSPTLADATQELRRQEYIERGERQHNWNFFGGRKQSFGPLRRLAAAHQLVPVKTLHLTSERIRLIWWVPLHNVPASTQPPSALSEATDPQAVAQELARADAAAEREQLAYTRVRDRLASKRRRQGKTRIHRLATEEGLCDEPQEPDWQAAATTIQRFVRLHVRGASSQSATCPLEHSGGRSTSSTNAAAADTADLSKSLGDKVVRSSRVGVYVRVTLHNLGGVVQCSTVATAQGQLQHWSTSSVAGVTERLQPHTSYICYTSTCEPTTSDAVSTALPYATDSVRHTLGTASAFSSPDDTSPTVIRLYTHQRSSERSGVERRSGAGPSDVEQNQAFEQCL